MSSTKISEIIKEGNLIPSFLQLNNLTKDICVFGVEHHFDKKIIIPKNKIDSAKIYNFSDKKIEIEVEINSKKGTGIQKEKIKYLLPEGKKQNNFNLKKCIQCENVCSCPLFKAIKYAKTYTPWVKFLN